MNKYELQLEEPTEFLHSEPGITHYAAHSECIDWVVSGDGDNACTVSHHDVLALASNVETRFFECSIRSQVIDPGNFGHASAHFDFAHICATDEIVAYQQIFPDRFANTVNGFCFCGALRPASREAGNRDAVALIRFIDGNFIFHLRNPLSSSIGPEPGIYQFSKNAEITYKLKTTLAMRLWLENFAYRIDLTPVIFIGNGLIALCIAWVTVSGTAAKAGSREPVLALRYE